MYNTFNLTEPIHVLILLLLVNDYSWCHLFLSDLYCYIV